jgi:hypothetical protein
VLPRKLPPVVVATLVWFATLLTAAPVGALAKPVLRGFVGVDGDGPLLYLRVNLGAQLDNIVANGVESVWRQLGTWPAKSELGQHPAGIADRFQNVDRVPTTFTNTDVLVGIRLRMGFPCSP